MRSRVVEAARRARRREERGASTVELVLYMPLLMIAMLLTVQFALVYLGSQAATAAAREGNRVARVTGQPGDGAQRARQYADDIGQGILKDLTVNVRQVGAQMETVVTGSAPTILPFLPDTRVTETVRGPIEEFREDTG